MCLACASSLSSRKRSSSPRGYKFEQAMLHFGLYKADICWTCSYQYPSILLKHRPCSCTDLFFSSPMNFHRGSASSPLYLKGVGFLWLQSWPILHPKLSEQNLQTTLVSKEKFFSLPQLWCFAHSRQCSLSTHIHTLRHCL